MATAGEHDLERELIDLVAALGHGGGLITPAVYDTAQVARFAAPCEGPAPALEWLTHQQDEDGGWGASANVASRHVSTLAAMLALSDHAQAPGRRNAIAAGAHFLSVS